MNAAAVAFRCASAFVDGLVAAGVEHACISPGSRSTPMALALARHNAVRVHVHLDERASAYFALGSAKATGRPTVVACTSGTASANLFPAVVEAAASRVPLVVLTADRPPELRGVGANQTIDQLDLYGRHAKSFEDAPVPVEAAEAAWRARGDDAAATAMANPPGPVHINLPFREPLVPSGLPPGTTSSRAPASSQRPSVPGDVASLVERIDGVERGVVYAGGLRLPGPC